MILQLKTIITLHCTQFFNRKAYRTSNDPFDVLYRPLNPAFTFPIPEKPKRRSSESESDEEWKTYDRLFPRKHAKTHYDE